jgi:PA14 domain-containing protein
LVRGNHALRLAGTIAQTAPARLEWLHPGSASQWQPISADVLFLSPPGGLGLQLTLTPGLDPHTQPMEEYVDPVLSHYYHLSPFSRLQMDPPVWTADWLGQLDAPEPGMYSFMLDHSQAAGVWIDDREVLGNLNGHSDTKVANLSLTTGRHAIRVRFEKTADSSPWINLYWTPPGAPAAIVPGSALFAPPPFIVGPAP